MDNKQRETLALCMGSACHQMGVYHVLPVLQALIKKYQVEDSIELKGSFCLGPCSHGMVMEFRGQNITDIDLKNIEQKFLEEVLPQLQKQPEE